MRDQPIRADGGPGERIDKIAEIGDQLQDIGSNVSSEASPDEDPPEQGVQLDDPDAPAPGEYDEFDTYLQEAQAWVTDELLAAAADLEHRTLELQQAVEIYPGVNDGRAEADTHRDVVVEDMVDVTGAVERLLIAGARLAKLEAAEPEH